MTQKIFSDISRSKEEALRYVTNQLFQYINENQFLIDKELTIKFYHRPQVDGKHIIHLNLFNS